MVSTSYVSSYFHYLSGSSTTTQVSNIKNGIYLSSQKRFSLTLLKMNDFDKIAI